MKDRRMKVRDITEIIGISVDRVHNILHKELEMENGFMTMDAAIADHRSKTHAKRYFAAVFVDASKRNSTRVWFVTLDETWIHYHTPESKQQSKQWTASGMYVKEGENCFVSQEDNFLGFPQNHLL